MGVHYRFVDDYVHFTYEGQYSLETMMAVWTEALAAPAFKSCRKILIDIRRSELNPLSRELENQASLVGGNRRLKSAKWALIAEPNSLVFGLGRMFALMADHYGVDVQVFTDFEPALEWLSADPGSKPT